MTSQMSLTDSARFSPCGLYRYTLTRAIGGRGGTVNFIMLNPSTADAARNDPTIRRCIGYASRWGFGDLVVTNIFAYRSTDPKGLKTVDDPVGPENDEVLVRIARTAAQVVLAWGAHGKYLGRGQAVRRMLQETGVEPVCLGLTSADQPVHPLYQPNDATRNPLPLC